MNKPLAIENVIPRARTVEQKRGPTKATKIYARISNLEINLVIWKLISKLKKLKNTCEITGKK